MKKMIIILICVLLALALLLVGVLVAVLAGGWQFSWPGLNASLANRRSFDCGDLQTIQVLYHSDRVEVAYTGGDQVVLEEYQSGSGEGRFAAVSQQGGQLRIEQDSELIISLFHFQASYTRLLLPQSWSGALAIQNKSGNVRFENDLDLASLRVDSGSGSVRFEGLETAGDLEISVSSGSLKGRRLGAGGDMRLQTGSGSIGVDAAHGHSLTAHSGSGSVRFGQVEAGQVQAGSGSGGVSFDRLDGPFAIETGSGSIEVRGGDGGGSARATSGGVRVWRGSAPQGLALKSGSGTVRVYLPRDTVVDFTASTDSGSIRTPFDESLSFSSNGKQASGRYGEGAPIQVECTTGSGNVRLEWA